MQEERISQRWRYLAKLLKNQSKQTRLEAFVEGKKLYEGANAEDQSFLEREMYWIIED